VAGAAVVASTKACCRIHKAHTAVRPPVIMT
jgi:hypothetical protein